MPPTSHSASTKVQRLRAARLLLWVALATAAIAALLVLLTEGILPRALRLAFAKRGAEVAGIHVEVGRVEVSLVRREVSIEDISLASSTGDALRSLRTVAELLAERPELAIRLHATATDADLATPERRADSDLDDEQWIADLETRRALAVASLLQDGNAVKPQRVRVGAAEFATLHPEPGVAIALDARPLPGTPEIPDFPQPEHDQSTPAVAAPPE